MNYSYEDKRPTTGDFSGFRKNLKSPRIGMCKDCLDSQVYHKREFRDQSKNPNTFNRLRFREKRYCRRYEKPCKECAYYCKGPRKTIVYESKRVSFEHTTKNTYGEKQQKMLSKRICIKCVYAVKTDIRTTRVKAGFYKGKQTYRTRKRHKLFCEKYYYLCKIAAPNCKDGPFE